MTADLGIEPGSFDREDTVTTIAPRRLVKSRIFIDDMVISYKLSNHFLKLQRNYIILFLSIVSYLTTYFQLVKIAGTRTSDVSYPYRASISAARARLI